jgi:hypothetical protein
MSLLKFFIFSLLFLNLSFAEEYDPKLICNGSDKLNSENKCTDGKTSYEPSLKCKQNDRLNTEGKCEDRQAQPTKE